MNWFDVLKNSELVQSQRQGMKPIDIQKPFKRVKEDDKNCYDEFVRIYEKTKNLFPNAEKTEKGSLFPGSSLAEIFHYGEFAIHLRNKIPQRGEIPDEVFCEAIKLYKNTKESSGIVFKNHYIVLARYPDSHYIAIWEGDYALGDADAFITLEDFSVDESLGWVGNNEGHLNQNFDGWRGSFI